MFDSIGQRVLFAYKTAYSDFRPVESDTVDAADQRALHTRMETLLDRLYRNPGLLGLPPDADSAYPWYLSSNRLPALNAVYMTVFKTLFAFYHFLYTMSTEGQLTDEGLALEVRQLRGRKAGYKPTYRDLLRTVGLEASSTKERVTLSAPGQGGLLAALQLLGRSCTRVLWEVPEGWRSSASLYCTLFFFAACCFDGGTEYLLGRIDALYRMNGLLLRLREDCERQGYSYAVDTRLTPTEYSFRVELKNGVGGFCIEYNPRKTQRVGFGTLNGVGEKAMLADFQRLDDDMKAHFIAVCKPCDDCLGCTKGGRNKTFTQTVLYNGKTYRLCPQFPRHSWETLDQARIDLLMKYHRLQLLYA